MILVDLTITGGAADEEVASLARELALRLQKNGQLVGDVVVGVAGPDLRLTGTAPLPDALSPENHSRYVAESLREIESRLKAPVEIGVYGNSTESRSVHFADPAEADWLILQTSASSLASPLRDPRSDRHFPLYRVPQDDDARERLWCWSRNAAGLDAVWWASGSLEVEAYKALAEPSSALMTEAREHAAWVEQAVGRPVFVHLRRHYGAPEGDDDRPCPLCGKNWRVSEDSDSMEGLPLRCHPCRLVSRFAVCRDSEDWSRFGS